MIIVRFVVNKSLRWLRGVGHYRRSTLTQIRQTGVDIAQFNCPGSHVVANQSVLFDSKTGYLNTHEPTIAFLSLQLTWNGRRKSSKMWSWTQASRPSCSSRSCSRSQEWRRSARRLWWLAKPSRWASPLPFFSTQCFPAAAAALQHQANLLSHCVNSFLGGWIFSSIIIVSIFAWRSVKLF